MSEAVSEFAISINQVDGYEFKVDFGEAGLAPLTVDEPPPLGQGSGPGPSHLLASAIGSCLSASLFFCVSKRRVGIRNLRTEVKVRTIRNENRRLRIGGVDVALHPEFAPEDRDKAARCLELFEEFCTVTQSIRDGIDVNVTVAGLGD